jgi:structural maintenance of chromosome 1
LLGELAQLESKHHAIQEEIDSNKQSIESCEKEIANLDRVIENLQKDVERERAPLAEVQTQIDALESVVHKCQNEVFAEFCVEIGVNDIREYQQGKLSDTQANAQRKLELSTAKAKLEQALVFESGRLAETKERLAKLTASLEKLQASLQEGKEEKCKLDEGNQEFQIDITELTENLRAARTKLVEHCISTIIKLKCWLK